MILVIKVVEMPFTIYRAHSVILGLACQHICGPNLSWTTKGPDGAGHTVDGSWVHLVSAIYADSTRQQTASDPCRHDFFSRRGFQSFVHLLVEKIMMEQMH